MTDDRTIIARCTRCGRVQWHHVAQQLGRSVDSVRRQYDPTFGAPMRCEPVEPEGEAEDAGTSSPYPRDTSLPMTILALLAARPESSETIALRTARPAGSIRARLEQLQAARLVKHDGALPRLWSLTAEGKTVQQGKLAIRSTGPARRLIVTGCAEEGRGEA